MGNFHIAFEALLKALKVEVVVPPRPTRRSVELGVRYSPEFVCFPFKATLGDLVLALRAGADTLIWFEGEWSCRYGYYGRLHHKILKDHGFKLKSLLFKGGSIMEGISDVRREIRLRVIDSLRALRVAWHKSTLVKLTESLSRKTRPYALDPKGVTGVEKTALDLIQKVNANKELNNVKKRIVDLYASIPKDNTRRPLKIMMVGEIYMVLEPEANFHLVEYLGEHGVLVTPFTTIHNWLFNAIGSDKKEKASVRKVATPYLPFCLGGEEQLSIGYTILARKRGFDGVIHLRPFTCMTENVVYPIIEQISHKFDIPVLSLSLDEHTESVGFFTRVEAFLELLHQRRSRQQDDSD